MEIVMAPVGFCHEQCPLARCVCVAADSRRLQRVNVLSTRASRHGQRRGHR